MGAKNINGLLASSCLQIRTEFSSKVQYVSFLPLFRFTSLRGSFTGEGKSMKCVGVHKEGEVPQHLGFLLNELKDICITKSSLQLT